MKRVFSLLYAAFPAVVLLGQTATPVRPADGLPATGIPSTQQLRLLPKRFPPEMMPSYRTAGGSKVKLTHSYCVYPSADRKSISLKPCESLPLRLVSPFGAPKKNPAK